MCARQQINGAELVYHRIRPAYSFSITIVTFSDLVRKIGVKGIQVEELYDLDGNSLLSYE